MNIDVKREGTSLTLAIEGEMDAVSSPLVDEAVRENTEGVKSLTFDLEKMPYLTSAGIRVLITAQKTMDRQGEMVLVNVCEDVRDVLAMTGLLDIFTVLS